MFFGVYSTRWCLFTFSDRAVDAVLEQCLEQTLGSRGSVTAEVAQTLPWLASTICVQAVALAGGATVISTLLQECAYPHPLGEVVMGLLNTLGMPFFRRLCAGERKDAHINVSSLFLSMCSLTSKNKLSSHDSVFDLHSGLQACRRRNIKVRNG